MPAPKTIPVRDRLGNIITEFTAETTSAATEWVGEYKGRQIRICRTGDSAKPIRLVIDGDEYKGTVDIGTSVNRLLTLWPEDRPFRLLEQALLAHQKAAADELSP